MQWSTLLEQANTVLVPTDDSTSHLAPLTHMGLIRVSGSDAAGFLQNMLTNDVNALFNHQAQLNGLCNPKGRLLAIFLVIKQGEDFLLCLPTELSDFIIQRLTMFKLRSDVSLTKVEDNFILGQPGQSNLIAEGITIQVPAAPELKLNILSPGEIETLSADTPLVHESVWQQAWINAGLPMIFKSSQEAFTPQQVNLDLVGGVSFKKGCYPGQEVVARLHYLGKPSRRLFLATLDSAEAAAPNNEVLSANGDVLGHVVQAVAIEEKVYCQVTLKLDQLDVPGFISGEPIKTLTAFVEEDA